MIKTVLQSGIYQLFTNQIIHAGIDEVWEFFSQPKNLNELTPENMGFEITTMKVDPMYAGQIISYKIEILPNIYSAWITEITYVQDKKMFVDEQRFGPYAMWHHEHHFEELGNGKVEMKDIVSYKLPMRKFGQIIAGNNVKNKVEAIFQYREKKVEEIFNNLVRQ